MTQLYHTAVIPQSMGLLTHPSAHISTQGKSVEALSAFSEDVYYCSLEYGPEDVRTSLGYYNMGKVFGAKVGAHTFPFPSRVL